MAVETPLNNVIFTVVQYNAGIIVPKISFFGMICPLLGGGGGLKKSIYPVQFLNFQTPLDSSISYSRLAGLSPSLSRSQTWNPMLGLINDLRDDRATISGSRSTASFESGLFVYILIITDLSAS